MTEQLIVNHLSTLALAVQNKSASGRGSGKKIDLYGIKKLRELILELAVRGKLVVQNTEDEPASKLLERIEAEKVRLVQERQIKKQKPLPLVTEDEKPFELPVGWEWGRLGNLSSNIHYGYTASAKHDSEGVRLLRITDIQNDRVDWETVPACEITTENSEAYKLESDDILIARTGGTVGKSYLVENISVHAVFASYLIRVKRISSMYAPFIKTYLGSQLYWQQLYDNASGTGQPNVNATALKSLIVPIPPLFEQKRIVTKVDELMALCDQIEQQTEASLSAQTTLVENLLATLTSSADAEELTTAKDGGSVENAGAIFDQNWQRIASHFTTLFTTEASIDQLKQTILQLAVMGKLVPQDPNDEPAAKLLERIAAEKAQLVKEGKIKKQKSLPPIAEDEKPFGLPDGWVWGKFDHIAKNEKNALKAGPFGSALKKSMYVESGYKIYGQEQVISGDENLGDYFIDEEKFLSLESCKVQAGDILISLVGTIGKVLIISSKAKEGIINPRLVKLSLFESICREYVRIILGSQLIQSELYDKSHGSTMNVLNLGLLRELVLPLPPVNEQHRIVTKVNQLMTLCDQIKTHLQHQQQTRLHLADAIVAQALNPTNPNSTTQTKAANP